MRKSINLDRKSRLSGLLEKFAKFVIRKNSGFAKVGIGGLGQARVFSFFVCKKLEKIFLTREIVFCWAAAIYSILRSQAV
jgi:hypothetical protein